LVLLETDPRLLTTVFGPLNPALEDVLGVAWRNSSTSFATSVRGDGRPTKVFNHRST